MAEATPVLRPKQSERLAATLNSPPLTWIWHSVALRKGMIPGSSRCTTAPRARKSSAPSGRMFKLPDMRVSLLRLVNQSDRFEGKGAPRRSRRGPGRSGQTGARRRRIPENGGRERRGSTSVGGGGRYCGRWNRRRFQSDRVGDQGGLADGPPR